MNTTMDAPMPHRRGPARRWIWAALLALAAVLAIAGAWAVGSMPWHEAAGLHSEFDVTVNGQPWLGKEPGQWLVWAFAGTAVAVLLVVALAVVLPLALGGMVLGVLLCVGLVLGVVALPILLVLAVLLSPLLALAGLAWMLFA